MLDYIQFETYFTEDDMQAIITKYHPATNTRGSRISATAEAGRVYIGYDCALSSDENHRAAAVKLCEKINAEHLKRYPGSTPNYGGIWNPASLVGGGLPGGDGYAFVMQGYRAAVVSLSDALKAFMSGTSDRDTGLREAREAGAVAIERADTLLRYHA
jgi:hypothetical protein